MVRDTRGPAAEFGILMTMRVELIHTADLSPELHAAIPELLVEVFAGEFEDDDWEHALGGMHVVLWDDDGALAGHASVIQRRLLHGGRALRTGYVEGVGVHPDRRRRGHGTVLMEAADRIVRGAYVLGALGATDEAIPLYEKFGWRRWPGTLFALTPDGVVRTPDEDGAVFVLPVSAELDFNGELTADWREGDCW